MSLRNGSSGFMTRANSNAVARRLRRPVRHRDAVGDVGEPETQRAVACSAPARQTPASWRRASGGRSTAPIPLRKLRRGRCLRVTIMVVLALPSRLERQAVDDFQDKPREPVFVLGQPAHDTTDRSLVVTLQAPAKGIGQQLGRQAVFERLVVGLEDGPQFLGPLKLRPSGRVPVESIGNLPSIGPPRADRVEVLEAEAERIHPAMARRAGRILAVQLQLLAHRGRGADLRLRLRFGTSGGGSGGGASSRLSSTHRPRSTGDVRVAYDETVSTLAWVSTPPRGVSLRSTRRNSGPDTFGMP